MRKEEPCAYIPLVERKCLLSWNFLCCIIWCHRFKWSCLFQTRLVCNVWNEVIFWVFYVMIYFTKISLDSGSALTNPANKEMMYNRASKYDLSHMKGNSHVLFLCVCGWLVGGRSPRGSPIDLFESLPLGVKSRLLTEEICSSCFLFLVQVSYFDEASAISEYSCWMACSPVGIIT